MPIVGVPLSSIADWDSFHATFAAALGFPDFYGRNLNAWIDCLTYEDEGMTAFPIETGDVLTLRLQKTSVSDAPRSTKRLSTA